MGNQIDWSAMDYVVEFYGIHDIDMFISELIAIREYLVEANR